MFFFRAFNEWRDAVKAECGLTIADTDFITAFQANVFADAIAVNFGLAVYFLETVTSAILDNTAMKVDKAVILRVQLNITTGIFTY